MAVILILYPLVFNQVLDKNQILKDISIPGTTAQLGTLGILEITTGILANNFQKKFIRRYKITFHWYFQAAGLGHNSIVEYILNKYPNCIHIGDSDGRTALHYAASFKKNETYDILLKFGANENIIDKVTRVTLQIVVNSLDFHLVSNFSSEKQQNVSNPKREILIQNSYTRYQALHE